MRNHLLRAAIFTGLAFAIAPAGTTQDKPGLQWEGMQKVEWKAFDEGYQTPGVDFRSYTKVMIDPTEAAFRKNWQRDYNKVHLDIENRVTDEDAQKILAEARDGLAEAFKQAAQKAGYQVVTAPGPDVLRLKPSLTDLDVHAPDIKVSAQKHTFAEDAGSARLVLEIRDSSSGALLAGGVDKRDIGQQTFLERRSSVSNRADFSRAFRRWAEFSFNALDGLRGMPARQAGG
jgi:hypothetical protein